MIPCLDNKFLTVSDGWAPLFNHFKISSSFKLTWAGLVHGLYVPNNSINLPSLGDLESAATIL